MGAGDRLTIDEIHEFIEGHFWWHSIDLGNGIKTPGKKPESVMRCEFDLTFGPLNVSDRSVLDVGAWNGGFSVEAARRGASAVAGLDHSTWVSPQLKGRETYDFVSNVTGFPFTPIDIDLDSPRLDLSSLGQFDIVLYLGVFYHLKNPIAATREIAGCVRHALVLETHIEQIADTRPAMVFYPGAELNNDGSNWWGPNTDCVLALLRDCGFEKITVSPGSDPARQIFHAFRS